ncbi:MAG: adenylyl-sulfate kinase [Lacunisphaera sp.]|nr:adenylyl-sulfate kinase [Lacunisphaera sp.]
MPGLGILRRGTHREYPTRGRTGQTRDDAGSGGDHRVYHAPESLRRLAREIVGRDKLDLVWVDTPLAICQQRDPKGLYQRAAAGNLPQFTGLIQFLKSQPAMTCRCGRTSARRPNCARSWKPFAGAG